MRPPGQTLEVMDRLSLEKKVHAALLKIGVNMSSIVVEVPARGAVHVYGASVSNQKTQNIETTVKGVSGQMKDDGTWDCSTNLKDCFWVYSTSEAPSPGQYQILPG